MDTQIDAPKEGEATAVLHQRGMDFAVNTPYGDAAERFEMHYGRPISTHLLRCMMERVPLPEAAPQADLTDQQRVTVSVDGCHLPMRSGWKEAKLGVVVGESHHVKRAETQRGCVTHATYVATMQSVSSFETHLQKVLPPRQARAERLQGKPYPEVVWLGDGAAWVWTMQQRVCPRAIPILDGAHARGQGVLCGKELFDDDEDGVALWTRRIETLLAQGKIDTLLTELKACRSLIRALPKRKRLKTLIRYYRSHRHRMDYPTHRAAGRLIGSGIVESGHRHVLQARMKRAGQHWSLHGAEKMARLRALYRTVGPKAFHSHALKSAA